MKEKVLGSKRGASAGRPILPEGVERRLRAVTVDAYPAVPVEHPADGALLALADDALRHDGGLRRR